MIVIGDVGDEDTAQAHYLLKVNYKRDGHSSCCPSAADRQVNASHSSHLPYAVESLRKKFKMNGRFY
jgi:hypothetical protein